MKLDGRTNRTKSWRKSNPAALLIRKYNLRLQPNLITNKIITCRKMHKQYDQRALYPSIVNSNCTDAIKAMFLVLYLLLFI